MRHLLFSLLKGLSTPEQKSYILMVIEQQNIDIDSYDLKSLPEYVEVIFIRRTDINSSLLKKKTGGIIKMLAGLNIQTSSKLQRYLKTLLLTNLIPIKKYRIIRRCESLFI